MTRFLEILEILMTAICPTIDEILELLDQTLLGAGKGHLQLQRELLSLGKS